MPYLFGIDSFQLAGGQVISSAQLDAIDFHICRIGTRGFGSMGSSTWYDRSFSIDTYCLQNIQATQAAGKPMGVYVFSYAWDAQSAQREADDVCDILDGWNVRLELPVFLDWESTGRPPGTGSYEKFQDYLGRTITTSELETIFTAFYQRCTQRGRRAGMYFNGWFVDYLLPSAWINSQRSSGNYFWLAQWQPTADPPHDCDIWQYAGEQAWMGITADFNYIINPGVISGGSNIPVWLMLKMARRSDNGKCTVLL